MVSASRCNLLSRSLPNYQKEVLDYTDMVANEFHNLLVDLRTHHHHQYKVRRVLEEIRDLEAEEMPFNDQPGMDNGDQFSALQLPEASDQWPLLDENDEPLLDLGADGNSGDAKGKSGAETGKDGGKGRGGDVDGSSKDPKAGPKQKSTPQQQGEIRRVGDPFSMEEVAEQARVNDLVLGGIEAELKALQNEVITPREAPPPRGQSSTSPVAPAAGKKSEASDQTSKSQAEKEIDDLLKLDSDLPDDSSLLFELEKKQKQQGGEEPPTSQDTLTSEWNNFSAFMPATREEGGAKSPLSGWERELMGSSGDLPDPLSPSELAVGESRDPATSVPSSSSSKAETSKSLDIPVSTQSSIAPPSSTASSAAAPASTPLPQFGDNTDHAPKDTPPGGADNDTSIDKLLGLSNGANSADSSGGGRGGVADELLSEELHSLGISHVKKSSSEQHSTGCTTSTSSDISSIDSSLFGLHSSQPSLPPPGVLGARPGMYPIGQLPQQPPQQVSPFRSPLGTTQGPPVFPTQGAMGMVMAPPKFGLVGPTAGATPGMQQVGVAPPAAVGGAPPTGGGAKEEEKGKTWMNFFAHLDPLVNEKA